MSLRDLVRELSVLALAGCLYEAQDPSLCQSVVNQLQMLDVSESSLSPMDLLSIGYLIGTSRTSVVARK